MVRPNLNSRATSRYRDVEHLALSDLDAFITDAALTGAEDAALEQVAIRLMVAKDCS